MTAIDQEWWEHLTPAAMHPHRAAIDNTLHQFIQSPYGSMWLRSALTPHGLIRVSPGQIIPVLHIAVLGNSMPILLPQRKVRAGHRFVGPKNMQSGRPLGPDEIPITPEIRFELVTDPKILASIRAGDLSRSFIGLDLPSQIFSTPAHHLLRPGRRPPGTYALYQHIFGHQSSYPDDGWFYVGITTRTWKARWAEHRRAIDGGSLVRFHQRYREERDAGRISYVHHKVMGVTGDVHSLFEAERRLIEGHWDDARRLNMSAGGKARRPRGEQAPTTPRRPRLTPEQVRVIRTLGDLATSTEIARRVMSSRRQVLGVISQRTYRSID